MSTGCISVFVLLPWLGQDFFPSSGIGQFILHLRTKSGARIASKAQPWLGAQRRA
jgi:hypothetical protein